MLSPAPTVVALRRERAATSDRTVSEVRTARGRLSAAQAELEEARAAHRQDPSALTQLEVDFWTTTVLRDERAVERAELALSGATQTAPRVNDTRATR